MGLCRHLGIVSRNSCKRSLGNLFGIFDGEDGAGIGVGSCGDIDG